MSLNLSLLRPVRLGWSAWPKEEDSGVFHGGGLQGHRVQPLVFPYLVAFSVLNDTTFPFQLFFLFFFSFAS